MKLGFSPDDLYCFTLSIDTAAMDGLDPNSLPVLLDTADWLLNRWTTPVLGRQ